MKRCSFKIAKAIKDAGYPQELKEGTIFYCENGLKDKYDSELYELFDPMYCVCPYIMEVWLWLWREKDMKLLFYPTYKEDSSYSYIQGLSIPFNKEEYNDPEVAIIAAIEYLVDNDLIK